MEELDPWENGSHLRSQFSKHLKHKLVPLVLAGQSVRLQRRGTWFAGPYQRSMAQHVYHAYDQTAGNRKEAKTIERVCECLRWLWKD